jgi:GTP-binding protein EngB required for normal cell division
MALPSLNDSQKRGILFSCLDLHRRMAEMEAYLVQGAEPTPFSQYVNDVSPTEAQVVRDYFARIRARMLTCLQEAGIPLELRRTSVRWALQCGMIFLHIAVAEMGPDRLRGYGPLVPGAAATVVQIQQDLDRLIERVGAYLRQGLGQDLAQRLARLDTTQTSVASLTTLDQVITRRGLVEFRPLLDQIVHRLEAPQFEVAVFGRVSSGKSSLLNHVAGSDVLPVGVTPITSVPTRLVRGDRPGALIFFAEGEPRTVGVGELRQYASEEGNPGNARRVTGILVQVPSDRLREGVVLVDTPGVGSLARAGSAETFAYLPRCDLGVVLIDAASTLTPDDLALIRLLAEAGVPAQVVLSKADLLGPADRQRAADYVRAQIRQELGLDLAVHPVSTVGADESLLLRWFEQELEPLLARHRALAEASLRRKIAHLRESVLATLQTLLARRQGGPDGRAGMDGRAVRRLLDEADEAVRQAQARQRAWGADRSALVEIILDDAARAVVSSAGKPAGAGNPVFAVVQQVLAQRGQMASEVAAGLQRALSRALEGARQAAPTVKAEADSIGGLAFRDLPMPDLLALQPHLHAAGPWWAPLLPSLAAWAVRRGLEKRLARALREQVDLHDRQVQAWLKACLGQLTELYAVQAEVYREQVRRLAGAAEGDRHDLEADLRELAAARSTAEGHQQA